MSNLQGSRKWKKGDAIDQGGQATVFRVKGDDGDTYAAKVVTGKIFQKKRLQRIKQEIEIVKKLSNKPYIVNLIDDNVENLTHGVSQEIFYIMDYAPHGSLRDNDFYIGDVESSLKLFKQILTGVSYAHKEGIIHRDLKPENILFHKSQQTIAISDFGLGLIKDKPKDEKISDPDEVVGPMFFIPPEQFRDSSKADQRSDIYSLGKILFFMLTGKGKVYREEIGNLKESYEGSNPYLPLIQEKLLDKMVIVDPKKRYETVEEIIEEVDKILQMVSGNSRRYLAKNSKRMAMYEYLDGDGLEDFLERFPKSIGNSMKFLEYVVEDLKRDEKNTRIENLKDQLLKRFPKGKIAASTRATFAFVLEPDNLKSLDKRNRYSFCAFYLARYFENANSHELAHKHLKSALDAEVDEGLKLEYLLLLAQIGKKCNCALAHDFENQLSKLLRKTDTDEKRIEIYDILGNHYLDIGDKPRGLKFLEAYLSIKPSDTSVRFKCAYQYSEIDQTALSLYHYNLYKKTLRDGDPSSVDNNLGVLYSNNGMPIKSMAAYMRASEEGHTLATSNIASQYLSIGLIDKARQLLRETIVNHPDGDYDDRINSVLGDVSKSKEREDEAEAKLESTGSRMSHHNTQSVLAFTKEPTDWSGHWNIGAPRQLIINIEKSSSAHIVKDYENPNDKIEIEFDGNIGIVKSFKIEKHGYGTYDYGVIYLQSENQFNGYLLKNEKEIVDFSGTKIEDVDTFIKKRLEDDPLQKLLATYKDIK